MSARLTESLSRVLMTVDAVGGVWTYALDVARGLSEQGVETILAVLGPAPRPDQIDASEALDGCRVLVTDLPLDWTAGSPIEVQEAGVRVAALAKTEGADLVHLNSPALAAKARFAVPTLGVCHSCVATWWDAVGSGPLPSDLAWRKDLIRRGYDAVDALIAPTAAFAAQTARVYGLREHPRLVRNGRPPVQDTSHSREPPPFVLTAGRLWDKGKNLETLDRAAARLALPVLAAGPQHGPNGESIAFAAIRPLGELSQTEIHGHLRARPVFASLARYEPFGLAVLEAAQAGCALVLSDIPSFRELWEGAAMFVPADDELAAAAAIERVVADAALRQQLGVRAARRAEAYSAEAMVAGLTTVYDAMLPKAALDEAAA